MHAYKVTIMALAAMLAAGCTNLVPSDSVEVSDLKKELSELRDANKDLQNKYVAQNQEMSRILEEVATITGKTSDLRIDVENGSARLTQAEQISNSIDQIKARIAALEKSMAAVGGKNKEFQKMIDGLNSVITEQELQINSLIKEIESKDLTIKAQKDTINIQKSTIQNQLEDLLDMVEKQAKSLYDAGVDLESIGDQAPDVSWKKNKEKVDVMRQNLYKKALSYYRQSYDAGYEAAKDKITAILAKIEAE